MKLRLHPKLTKFDKLEKPPPRVRDAIRRVWEDPQDLSFIILDIQNYFDWFSLEIVKMIEERPSLLQILTKIILASKEKEFRVICVQAASYLSIGHIKNPDFSGTDSRASFIRRNLYILGDFIGDLTLGSRNIIFSNCLNLKELLLYGFSQGKLYGIVPFVTNILMKADNFFLPPNPFTSGILHILAGILKSDSLKSSIKNPIRALFEKMHISVSMFANINTYFPDVVRNNNDYLISPFSLEHFTEKEEMEKILNFDEESFMSFSLKNVVFPDSPIIREKPELKEKLSQIIAQQAYNFIKAEGTNMAKVAASTASSLVYKDFHTHFDMHFLQITAKDMAKQLTSSLTIFTAPSNLSRQLFLSISKDCFDEKEQEYFNIVTQKNYEWITQLFRDVVSLLAQKEVLIMLSNQQEPKSKLITHMQYARSQIQTQHFMIYANMIDLSSSPQPFPILDLEQAKINSIEIDPDFGNFLEKFTKLIPVEYSHNAILDQQCPNYYEEAIQLLLKQCPNLNYASIDLDKFKSILKTLLTPVTSINHDVIFRSVCKIVEKILPSVSSSIIEQSQPFLKQWIQSSLRSHFIICEFLKMKLITDDLLDTTFPQMLDSDPFNAENACFIISVLYYGIFKDKSINPTNYIRTLGCLAHVTHSNIDNDTTGALNQGPTISNLSTIQMLDELQKLYIELDSPNDTLNMHLSHQPNNTSILTTLDETNQIKIKNLYNELQKSYNSLKNPKTESNSSDDNLKIVLLETSDIINDIIVYLIQSSNSNELVLYYIKVLVDNQIFAQLKDHILFAVAKLFSGSYISTSNIEIVFNLIYLIFENYLKIFESLNDSYIEKENLILEYGRFLHEIRPALYPVFSFCWIQLFACKKLTKLMLETTTGCKQCFTILLLDFISLFSQIGPTNDSDIFDRLYISLLRFILILQHDYPLYILRSRLLLVSFIPQSFYQLKNIINSVDIEDENPQNDYTIFSYEDLNETRPKEFIELANSLFAEDETSGDKQIDKGKIIQLVNYIQDKYDEQGLFIKYILHLYKDDIDKEIDILLNLFRFSCVHTVVIIIENIIDLVTSTKDQDTQLGNTIITKLTNTTTNFKYSKVCISEMVLRAIITRVQVKSPLPSGLKEIISQLLNNDSPIYNFNYVKNSPLIRVHIQTLYKKMMK